MEVDAWQTEYAHILQGTDPVLEWVRGTGLRPVLQALSPQDGERSAPSTRRRLRDAYPARRSAPCSRSCARSSSPTAGLTPPPL